VVSGAHESCAAHNHKVSQVNTNCIMPLSTGCCTMHCSHSSYSGGGGGGGGCGGGCFKKRCNSKSSRDKNVATFAKKASGGTRVPMDAQKKTPGPISLLRDLGKICVPSAFQSSRSSVSSLQLTSSSNFPSGTLCTWTSKCQVIT
jgi:hypothetical protein